MTDDKPQNLDYWMGQMDATMKAVQQATDRIEKNVQAHIDYADKLVNEFREEQKTLHAHLTRHPNGNGHPKYSLTTPQYAVTAGSGWFGFLSLLAWVIFQIVQGP